MENGLAAGVVSEVAADELVTLVVSEPLDDNQLVALRQELRLGEQGQPDERYLPNDGTFRARLRLGRTEATAQWMLSLSNEGRRPPEERIDQWRQEIVTAAAAAGLTLASEWRSPAPDQTTPPTADPIRTSLPVQRAYTARFDGALTQERLDRLRDTVGLNPRGSLDDDRDELFGVRTVRAEQSTPVLLRLYRQDEHHWLLALTYQGEPPAPEQLESVRTAVRVAAAAAELVLAEETPGPP